MCPPSPSPACPVTRPTTGNPILAPGGTPPAIVKQLHEAIKAAAATPTFRQRAASEGLAISLEAPQAAAAFILAEEAKWRRVVKEQAHHGRLSLSKARRLMIFTLHAPLRQGLMCLAALCASAGVSAQTPAQAQAPSFASKPIRLVVPFPAGGGVDVIARSLAEGLARELGQSVVIDNRAGAGTAIGNDTVAKAPADGMTILLNTNAIAIIPSLNPKLPYVTETAFAPITLLGRAPIVAVVRAESPLRTGADFIARARAKPGALTYGSARQRHLYPPVG